MPPADFPPPYTVRTSARAKRIGLRIRPGLGLEVVLPAHSPNTPVGDILERFRPWIERHYPRLCPEGDPVAPSVPQYFFLRGGKELVVVKGYNQEGAEFSESSLPLRDSVCGTADGAHKGYPPPETLALAEEQARLLLPRFAARTRDPLVTIISLPDVQGQKGDRQRGHQAGTNEAVLGYMREWVRKKAKEFLSPLLEEESRRNGLPYSKLSLRFQKTRWGSCSGKKAISLNACLLFLPDHLARYIILHELCHTRVMNHSAAYWRLLFTLDEQALRHDKSMRGAWQYVPGWVMG